ncbi:MAG: FAD-dependent oxidoreductase [Ruminococcaceae bacterium]|nr:FAD-dependent oxidoreductase [Oscillospiraceae bacterium]
MEFDIVIAGGGLAGVFAAVSAAREGMKVLIVEKCGFLGGMATSGLVFPFMSYRERGSGAPANAGLFAEFLRRMAAIGGTVNDTSTAYKEEYMKLILDRMVREAGVKVLFHSLLSEVERDGRIIKSITISTCEGNIKVTAPVFIDATGDADLTAFAGLEYELGRESDGLCQPMTLNFRMTNVDWSKYDRKAANALYKEFREKGLIKNPREDILVFRYPIYNIMHFNTTRIVGKNPVSVYDVSESEMIAREQMFEMLDFLKKNVAGFEDADIVASAGEIGIRESRRIVGHYVIKTEDVTGAVKHDDRIARATYEIDIHNPAGTGTYHCPVPENDYYTIPYRALIPVGADNLLVAGRPISSTHEAHSSLRIMPITSCIGEAAGAAASLMRKADAAATDIDVTRLQNILTDHGALI